MNGKAKSSWLEATVSLPLQLPRDIQLEYHSPANWKKVQTHRHIQTAPVSYGYGEGPLQEEDANVLASRERDVVASRKAGKAAQKQAAEESLRVRLIRLTEERHAAMQKKAPVLSAAVTGPLPHKEQKQAPLPGFQASSELVQPGYSLRERNHDSQKQAKLEARQAPQKEQRVHHLAGIARKIEKHVQECEASAVIAGKARMWLQGKANELAGFQASYQIEQQEGHNQQNIKHEGISSVTEPPTRGYVFPASASARFRSDMTKQAKPEPIPGCIAGSRQDLLMSFLDSKSSKPAEADTSAEIERRIFGVEATAASLRNQHPATSPLSSPASACHPFQSYHTEVLNTTDCGDALRSGDLLEPNGWHLSEIGSLVNEVGSELDNLSLEQSASDAEGWLVSSRPQAAAQESTFSLEESPSAEPLKKQRPVDRLPSSEATGGCSQGDQSATAAEDDCQAPSNSVSGASHGQSNGRILDGTNGLDSRAAPAMRRGSIEEAEIDDELASRGKELEEKSAQGMKVRGAVRKREVFDEHGMGGQYFAAVWKSYSEWERQKGQGWARKQQQLEEQRKARIEWERRAEMEAVLAAERRAAEEEEEKLLRSRQTALERSRARAEAERLERAIRELENERFSSAMLAKLSERAKATGIVIPQLCSCGHATCPLSPTYTVRCAHNCQIRKSWDVYQKTLSDLLHAVGLL